MLVREDILDCEFYFKKIQDRTMIKTQLNMLPETGDMYRKGQVLQTAIAEKRESAT